MMHGNPKCFLAPFDPSPILYWLKLLNFSYALFHRQAPKFHFDFFFIPVNSFLERRVLSLGAGTSGTAGTERLERHEQIN
uniref:Uncharacterized protein n=1 Tax=Bursaphelenchus xylophilus TaxID=6326 RepID=A0A1I7RMG1_BURXY